MEPENNPENEQLEEMETERQNRLAEKSGKQMLKKQQKKDAAKQVKNVIIKAIIAKIQFVAVITLITSIVTIILVTIFTSLLKGSLDDDSVYFYHNMNERTATLTLQQYLVQFSHSGEAPQSDDGRFYKMYGDGVGWPTIGNSDLQWKSHQSKFAVAGKVLKSNGENTESNVQDYVNSFLTRGANEKYSNSEIDSMGIYIEKELVDSVGQTVAETYYQTVQTVTQDLNLSEQQLYALTTIQYNFGYLPTRNGYTFKSVYEAGAALYTINSWEHMKFIWDNWWCYVGGGAAGHIPMRDAAFETYVKGVYDFTFSEAGEVFGRSYYIYYTQAQLNQFSYAPKKPITRTDSNEQEIFTYTESAGSSEVPGSTESAGSLLEAAEIIHTKYEREVWTYSVTGLYFGDIKRSMNHPRKITCCATFVSESLYLSGLLSEEEINSFNYNSSSTTYKYLLTLEGRFVEVKSYANVQAGDIVYMSTNTSGPGKIGHTQICAGNQTWYNAGSTKAIQRDSPYRDTSSVRNKFITAIRPLKGGNR